MYKRQLNPLKQVVLVLIQKVNLVEEGETVKRLSVESYIDRV